MGHSPRAEGSRSAQVLTFAFNAAQAAAEFKKGLDMGLDDDNPIGRVLDKGFRDGIATANTCTTAHEAATAKATEGEAALRRYRTMHTLGIAFLALVEC